jgi:hypothetical protein
MRVGGAGAPVTLFPADARLVERGSPQKFGRFKMRLLLAALAGLACLTSAALAQEPDRDPGLWCVYDAISYEEDYVVVAEDYLENVDPAGEAKTILDKAQSGCATELGLSEMQAMVSGEYGRIGATLDYLSEEFFWSGIDEDIAAKVFELTMTLSDTDYETLYEEGWSSGALGTKLRPQLVQAGVPADDEYLMGAAFDMMTLYAYADEAALLYTLEDDGDSN